MSVSIEVCYQVRIDGSNPWKVATDGCKTIEGRTFARLRPYDKSFVNLVCHDSQIHPSETKGKRLSLAGCDGFKSLLKLRNEAVAALENAEAQDDCDSKTADLFEKCGDEGRPKKGRYVPRMNAARLQALRDAPELMEFLVPGFDETPDLTITCVRPAHPCDEMWAPLEPDTIAQVVRFIRTNIAAEHLLSRRQYASGSQKGVWRNGSAGTIMKLGEEEPGLKKYKVLKEDAQLAEDAPPALQNARA